MKNYVIGGSIIGFKYNNGICIASDSKLSYGSLHLKSNISRILILDENSVVAFSGDFSDIQYVSEYLLEEKDKFDGTLENVSYLNLVQKLLYNRRSQLKPLNVFCIVASVSKNQSNGESINPEIILGGVNLRGNFFLSDVISSDLGEHIAVPYLRSKVEGKSHLIDKDEAKFIAEETMKMLYGRSVRSSNNIQLAFVENTGVEMTDFYDLKINWEIGEVLFD
ncbi:putative proteasome subunit beta type-7 [Dictyocoela muelleri]|nr:putative proteasome subunit beta type-7 [Dictyocoela muelleri]